MTTNDFYDECARLLKCQALGSEFSHYKRTRWNNRTPGRGRFEGRGIIRCFGEQVHLALNTPRVHKIFQSKEDAIEFLKTI